MTTQLDTRPTPSPPDAGSQRPSFDELKHQCRRWRQFLLNRWAGIDDIAEVIDAALFEVYMAGVTDERAAFDQVSTHVRRYVRSEARQRRRFVPMDHRDGEYLYAAARDVDELAEVVAARTDAARIVAGLEIPPRAAGWLAARCGEPVIVKESDAVWARRWRTRTRDLLTQQHPDRFAANV